MTIVGYTLGCFDLMHVGHINLLRNAKGMCDKLIVGVLCDEHLKNHKGGGYYSLQDRLTLVKGIKYCDAVVPEYTNEKIELWKKYKFDVLFTGDDWVGSPEFERWEKELNEVGCKVVYISHTRGVSTTQTKRMIKEKDAN